MFTTLSILLLACYGIGIRGQSYTCSRDSITQALLTECLNAVRVNSDSVDDNCRQSTKVYRPLRRNAKLEAAAQAHAVEMERRRQLTHSSSDGSGPSDRAKAEGYTGSVGENIAWNYNTPFRAFSGWLCSPGHRANILSCKYDEVGSGVQCGSNGCYSAQKFGCSTGFDCCSNVDVTSPTPPDVPVNPPPSPVPTTSPPSSPSPTRSPFFPSPTRSPPSFPSPTSSPPFFPSPTKSPRQFPNPVQPPPRSPKNRKFPYGYQPPRSFGPTNPYPRHNPYNRQQYQYNYRRGNQGGNFFRG